MDLRQLRYFQVLATQENFGRAAEILRIAQPALSRQIRLLEEELGVTLFERHARGVNLTADASVLLERVTFLLRYAEQTKLDLASSSAIPRGPVALGLPPGLSPLLVPPLLRRLRERYPEIYLKIIETFQPVLHDRLTHGLVDLAIVNGPISSPDLEAIPLFSDAICAIVPFDETRIGGQGVDLRLLDRVPLILTGVQKSGIRLELETAAARANVTLWPVVEVESVAVAKLLIRDGIGWTVHFAAAVQDEVDAHLLRAVPIIGLRLHRYVAWAVGRPRSRAVRALAELLRELVRESVGAGIWPNTELALPRRASRDASA
jgi:LysR family nitrogen assimilation transcriptional regulator